jgi:hypothetical protein
VTSKFLCRPFACSVLGPCLLAGNCLAHAERSSTGQAFLPFPFPSMAIFSCLSLGWVQFRKRENLHYALLPRDPSAPNTAAWQGTRRLPEHQIWMPVTSFTTPGPRQLKGNLILFLTSSRVPSTLPFTSTFPAFSATQNSVFLSSLSTNLSLSPRPSPSGNGHLLFLEQPPNLPLHPIR